ncbi:caspase family protein [Phanerochaete sordida]|uniref:Caspase family protein n=1 Tax=Phanerochaete sordida TaxID=48140 RepID=A0A9P3L7W3_9APHY|nr:caspase family protein [Phanerochaete sordida]
MSLTSICPESLGFRDIVTLRDDVAPNHPLYPSKSNMMYALQYLVAGAKRGDHLVFHFSGHGSQRTERVRGNEADHKDEAIWPADARPNHDLTDAENIIIDDWIKEELVDKVPPGATLTILLDCCHSGTGADLQYSYTDPDVVPTYPDDDLTDSEDGTMPIHKPKLTMSKLMTGGSDYDEDPTIVVSWAACQDPHSSLSLAESGGFFVKAFIDEFRNNWGATHEDLLHCIKERMIQAAQDHFQSLRSERKMKRKYLRILENWWEDNHSEPVLGILYNEDQVLSTPVVDTLGYDEDVGGGCSDAFADTAEDLDQDPNFGGGWQNGDNDSFRNSSAGFDRGTTFDDGWQNDGMGGNPTASFAQDLQQDFSQDFGQDFNW